MIDCSILWRFVFEAPEQAEARAAADEVARLLGLEGLPPVKPYKEANWWITDTVVTARSDDLAALFGRQLALAGRLGNEWNASALASLAEGGECFATFNAADRNAPAVAGLRWAVVEVFHSAEVVSGG